MSIRRAGSGTLRSQLVGLTAALVGFISLFMLLFFPAQLRREAVADLLGRTQIVARMTAFGVSPAVVFRDAAVLDEGLQGARRNPDLALVVVTDTAGTVIAGDSGGAAREAMRAAARGDVVWNDMAVASVPLETNGRVVGRLYVGLSLSSVVNQVRRARLMVAIVVLVVFGAALAAVFAIGAYVTRPLEVMVAEVDAIGPDDRDRRASTPSSEEVAHLAAAFNRMLDRLDQAQRQLEDVNRTLESRVAARTTELEATRDQLVHAQKMEAVGRLAGGVAHDFNNILTVIVGNTELALERLPADDPTRPGLAEVLHAARRARDLAAQLLAFGRKQVLQAAVLDVNRLVDDAESMLRRLIGEDVELRVVAGPKLPRVRVDATQLQQVILNLAVNARDAMPNGGVLAIETGAVDADEAYVRAHPPLVPGRWVRLTVRDTGVGMDEHVRSHLFEPFFTTKPVGKGTGLGLATAYGIVRQSGGYVLVESVLGQGSALSVMLPAVDAVEERAPEVVEPTAKGGTETVLVVEDEKAVRVLACRILAVRGYRVLSADSAEEALRVVERHGSDIQCLVSDVVMPGMSGLELGEHLRGRLPGIRLLFTSGYAADAVELRGGLLPDSTFLPKPYTADELTLAVRAVLDGAAIA